MRDKQNAMVYFDLILRIRPDMEELQEPLSQVFADEEFPTKALSQHVVNIITQGEATEEELAEYLCNEDYKDTVKTDDAKQNLIQKLLSDEGINN